MADAAQFPPSAPDPLPAPAPIPDALAGVTAHESFAPLGPAEATVLGSAGQYRRAPTLPSFENLVSITGATKEDPAGKLTRQQVLYDPDWASPTAGFWVVLVRGYGFSFLMYWFGYGFSLILSLGIVEVLFGQMSYLTPNVLGTSVVVGPLLGCMLDYSIQNTHSAFAFTGEILLLAEPLLMILILITHEWSARLRYLGLMFGLVLVKAVVYVLVNSAA